jgi:Uma2 family endonuclease
MEVWEKLTPAERARVCDALPSEFPRATPPEGDRHRRPKERAIEALGEFFRRIGRRVYLSSELPVYYPDEPMFAPDVIAVLDVDPHERDRWVVAQEGKGLDVAMEVTLRGDSKKDLETNVERYARLGIREYFVFDARSARLVGYRLEGSRYQPIVPQGGRWASHVLALDLSVDAGRMRFLHGSAPLLEAAELIGQLERMTDDLVRRKEEAEREREAAHRETEAAHRETEAAHQETEAAKARAKVLAAQLRALGIEPEIPED